TARPSRWSASPISTAPSSPERAAKDELMIISMTLSSALILGSDGNIFKISPDGTGKTYLTDDSTEFLNFTGAWSYDGSKIIYTRQEENQPPYVWTMNADGGDKEQLTFGQITGAQASFSPNGKL